MEEEPAKEIEPEYIEIKAHERKRKKKQDLNEQFRDIPVRQEWDCFKFCVNTKNWYKINQ